MSTPYPKISLKAARVNAGLSQRQAAARIGVCLSTIRNYENGSTIPSWDKVRLIQIVYEFPTDYIFFTGDPLKA